MTRRRGRSYDSDTGDVPARGHVGRVTGTVGPGLTGEVMLPIRGGSEAYTAYPYIETETLPIGTPVVVMEYAQPRIVYVAAAR
jgi:hypothetical protein